MKKKTPAKKTPTAAAKKADVLADLTDIASGKSAAPTRAATKKAVAAGKTAKAKATKKATKKKPAPAETEPELSNKAVVYLAWVKAKQELDADKALALVGERVKRTTIIGWMSAWGRGQNLPAVAKK